MRRALVSQGEFLVREVVSGIDYKPAFSLSECAQVGQTAVIMIRNVLLSNGRNTVAAAVTG